ncbi:Hypothetical predicted protein [Paramuricea clavata]|uniref:Uncharacterized protein n=1 Tax=Paramuricea clavata TaxID=317549 RepID=A0A6S7I8H6_PARCT|nr:Hypothetical predicted protein [Paramuricea clavata]
MATDPVQEEKIFVGEQNEADLAERKDYEADFDTFDEEDRPPAYQEHESDPLSDFEHNVISDEDTESLTGSLDGVTGGDEYELTGDDTEYHSDPVTKQTRQEKLRMLALRRHLDLLSEQVLQNDYLVNQSSEELKKCQENIQSLETEIQKIAQEIELQESNENTSSIYRLKSQYTKLCSELETEREVAVGIRERLVSAEYSLSLATMEQGRFLLAGEELEKEEQLEMKNKAEASAGRIRKENVTATAAEKRRRIREKDHITTLRERERKHRHAINMAKRSREQASKFLKETMSRVRLKEAEEEEFHRVDMENRIKNLLSLKSNIESNKESLRAVEARRVYLKNEQEQRDHQEREEILTEGLNPDEVLTRRKRIRQFEKDKETFEKRQRERQIEIADKLVREEKQMKKRYQQQPQLWTDKQRDRNKRFGRRKSKSKSLRVYSGSSSMEYSADAEDAGGAFVPSKLITVSSDDEDEFSPFGHTSRDEEKEGDSDHEGDDLAEPEFRGLWEENEKNENKNLDRAETKLKFTDHIPSKTEQEMMERALMKQKESIVQKQVAVGREFKGQAFYSKPEVVIFKDFNIGKSYRKKVVLTNVSYTQNFCKYIGMSSHLLDFIDIIYDPPGAMSAGLTCDFTVIFKPMLNEDLVGQIDFLAQTGPFSVPVKCFTKKCQVSVDKNEINYGSQVLGEICKKTIMLINDGALATKFNVKKIQAEPASVAPLPESELGSNIAENSVGNKHNEEQSKIGNDRIQDQANIVQTHQDTNIVSKQQEPGQEDAQDCVDGHEGEPSQMDNVFTVGKVSCGDLLPFSSVQVDIIFAPVKPGDSSCLFEITFEDTATSPIIITAQGTGIDVPVWVDREVVDLKICMFDRLYQDAIVVNNRATSALRLKFEVCKELKNHLELLPKTAYIQAQSQFSAQLKFLPRKTLFEDCPECFNNETGLLEVPLVIRVADQTRPVHFTMRAIITPSDIEFSVSEVNLGYCTTVESVRQTITMTNKSILAQMYGFCGVPECFEVQPNDGFGTLLPLESLDIDIIFSAKKAQEYNLELVCKNGIGTEYRVSCRGIGVYPPLALSQSTISFRATAVADSSIASLEVVNSHTDGNEFTHEVPRIGQGPVAKLGPTTFEFVVPPGAPVTISPAVGVVMPGQSCNIEVTFSPRLPDSDVMQEACRIAEKMAEIKRKMSEENAAKEKLEDVPPPGKKQLGKVGKKSGKGSPKRGQTPASTPGIRNQTTPNKTSKDFKEG